MKTETLQRRLTETSAYDMNVHSPLSSSNGWKISIQGKSISDSIFLYDRLSSFLIDNNIPFKVATINRYALKDTRKEQSNKAMTIYCPNGMDFSNLCEDVYSRSADYKGWLDIKTPSSYEHYAGGLFTRNDRAKNGAYVPAN